MGRMDPRPRPPPAAAGFVSKLGHVVSAAVKTNQHKNPPAVHGFKPQPNVWKMSKLPPQKRQMS